MSSELAVNDVSETDDKSTAAVDRASSVARCRQITVVSEAAPVPPSRNSEPAAAQPRDSAVSVHRTLVVEPSQLGSAPAEEMPRRSSSRKATLAFDYAALQAAERDAPAEDLTVSSTRLRAVRSLTVEPVLSASNQPPAARMPWVLAATKAMDGRYALAAFLITMLCTLLATAILAVGDMVQPEQPRLLHLVRPRAAAAPAESTADLDWIPRQAVEERGRIE